MQAKRQYAHFTSNQILHFAFEKQLSAVSAVSAHRNCLWTFKSIVIQKITDKSGRTCFEVVSLTRSTTWSGWKLLLSDKIEVNYFLNSADWCRILSSTCLTGGTYYANKTMKDHIYPGPAVKHLTAKLFNLNFHPLEFVSRWRDPQLQVSENYSDLTIWRSTVFKYCWLMSHFIFNMFKRWYLMC